MAKSKLTIKSLTLIIFSTLIAKINGSYPMDRFIPFGVGNGDTDLRPSNLDDGSSEELSLNITFPFFEDSYDSLWVNINGLISLSGSISSPSPNCNPLSQAVISPFWADIDLNHGGNIFYRQTSESSVLATVNREVNSAFPQFNNLSLNWVFVSTWFNVTFYGAGSCTAPPRNTFQSILTSNGINSFVILYYNNISWSSSGSCGFGANPARCGYDAGDGVSLYNINGSCTNDIITINERSNVGTPGVWVFRIDNAEEDGDEEYDGEPVLNFMPFGRENGDRNLRPSDLNDGSSPQINLNIVFPFLDYIHTSLWVNLNGLISLLGPTSEWTPTCQAVSPSLRMIAPFWADSDMSLGGNVYYRQTFNASLLAKAKAEIVTALPEFNDTFLNWAYIVTWYRMPFYGSNSSSCDSLDSRNTFQTVLVSNGIYSFAIFYYNNITWTTGTDNGGNCSGLGGNPARAGFDAGDGNALYSIPGSCTNDIITINQRSNIGTPGVWVFRVDTADNNNSTQPPPISTPITTTTTTTTTAHTPTTIFTPTIISTTSSPISTTTTQTPDPCLPSNYRLQAVISSIQYETPEPELVDESTETLILIPRTVINNTSPGSVTEKILYNEEIEETYKWFYPSLNKLNVKIEQNIIKLPPIVRRNIANKNRKENLMKTSRNSKNGIEIVYSRDFNIDRTIEVKPQTSIDYKVYAQFINDLKFDFIALAEISGNDTQSGNHLSGTALSSIFENCANNFTIVEINDYSIVAEVNGLLSADLITGLFFEVNSQSNDNYCEPSNDQQSIPSDHIKSRNENID